MKETISPETYLKLYKGSFLKKVKNSIRPITRYLQNGEVSCYNYGICGSGFFIKYGETQLFITARHNFVKGNTLDNFSLYDNSANSFFIIKDIKPCDLKDISSRIEIDTIYLPAYIPENRPLFENSDLSDIAVASLNQKLSTSFFEIPYNPAFMGMKKLGNDDTERSYPNDLLWVIGHPSENNFLMYGTDETVSMSLTRTHLLGTCTSNDRGIGRAKIAHDSDINNYDGFSGSPVFKISQEKVKLTGMVIRGGNKIIYYISIEHIYLYLFRLDVYIAKFEYSLEQSQIRKIISFLNESGVPIQDSTSNRVIIKTKDSQVISINPNHDFLIKALKILIKNKNLITKENLYILQEFIILNSNNPRVIDQLSQEKISQCKIESIKKAIKSEATIVTLAKEKTVQPQ